MDWSTTDSESTNKLLDEEKNNFGSISTTNSDKNKNNNTESSSSSKKKSFFNSDFYFTWIRPLIAEFFGTLIFAFIHSTTAYTITHSPYLFKNALLPAFSDGLAVTVLVILFGPVSGGHVNFAVTVAVVFGKGIRLALVPLYFIFQILGSIAGAGIALLATGQPSGYFEIGHDATIGQALIMEIMLTTLLTLAVLLAELELKDINAAFAIGFSILIGVLAGFEVSGGGMNPSLSFGPALISGHWKNYWIYWVGPILGAIQSGIWFRLFFSNKCVFKRDGGECAETAREP